MINTEKDAMTINADLPGEETQCHSSESSQEKNDSSKSEGSDVMQSSSSPSTSSSSELRSGGVGAEALIHRLEGAETAYTRNGGDGVYLPMKVYEAVLAALRDPESLSSRLLGFAEPACTCDGYVAPGGAHLHKPHCAIVVEEVRRMDEPRCHRTLGCTRARDHGGACEPSDAPMHVPAPGEDPVIDELVDMDSDLIVTERAGAIRAFEQIMSLVEHDSPVHLLAAEQHAWLKSEQDRLSSTSSTPDFSHVARACVIELLRRLDYFQACPLCDAGQPDDDGGDKPHDEECPLRDFNLTKDVEALRAWAKG